MRARSAVPGAASPSYGRTWRAGDPRTTRRCLRPPPRRHERDVGPPRRLPAARLRSTAPRGQPTPGDVSSGSGPGRRNGSKSLQRRGEIACTVSSTTTTRKRCRTRQHVRRRTAHHGSAGRCHIGAARLRQPHEQHVREASRRASRVEGVRAHQAAFQAIADANDDLSIRDRAQPARRATRTSVEYVVRPARGCRLRRDARRLRVRVPVPAAPRQLTPATADHPRTRRVHGDRQWNRDGSGGSCGHQPRRRPRATRAAAKASPTSRASPAGAIALIQRGTCSLRRSRLTNAQTAGADAVIIFNQGDTTRRRRPTLGPSARHVAPFATIRFRSWARASQHGAGTRAGRARRATVDVRASRRARTSTSSPS